MSLEFFRRFLHKDQPQPSEHEIVLGIPFKPFEREARFCVPGEGNKPFLIPEEYPYVLALRRPVSLYGMKGCIDIVSEDPNASFEALLAPFQVSQPFGLAFFEIDYHGKDDQRIRQEPFILRFTFHPKTQLVYTKLLNSYVEVKCGENHYVLPWNIRRKAVEWNMQQIGQGNNILVVEKNLFDEEKLSAATEGNAERDEENRDIDRIGYVWLPKNLEQFRTIEMTFRNIDHGNGLAPTSDPSVPRRKPEPILF